MNSNAGMTDKEAGGRSCPLMIQEHRARTVTEAVCPGNPLAGSREVRVTETVYRRCVGSGCAMWTLMAGSDTHGYCGIRGKVVIP